jgi:hypothetical protein
MTPPLERLTTYIKRAAFSFLALLNRSPFHHCGDIKKLPESFMELRHAEHRQCYVAREQKFRPDSAPPIDIETSSRANGVRAEGSLDASGRELRERG